jgi:hypothetical protein
MIAFPGILVQPALVAGIPVPQGINVNTDDFDREEFPHFAVFCTVQLGAPLPYPQAHWDNAEVIAKIPANKIKTITSSELVKMGFQTGFPIP